MANNREVMELTKPCGHPEYIAQLETDIEFCKKKKETCIIDL